MKELEVQSPTNTKQAIKAHNNAWEKQQKERFAAIASDKKNSYDSVIKYALAEDRQNHKMARVSYSIHCFRNDGVYQLNRAIEKVFGVVSSHEENTPSGGENAITTIDVQLAGGKRVKCPYGDISLEGLGEGSMISINYDNNSHELYVTGKCQVRFQSMIDEIIEETRRGLAKDSIYKGQAIEISDINEPQILDLSMYQDQLMVLSKKTIYDLKPIYARINHPERCIENGIPLKFGALLEGGLIYIK